MLSIYEVCTVGSKWYRNASLQIPGPFLRCMYTYVQRPTDHPCFCLLLFSQEISLQATDSVGATATATLRFIVLPENDPPVLEMAYATYDSSRLTHDGLSGVVESVDLLTVKEDQDTAVPGLSVRDADVDVDGLYIFGGDPGPVDGGLVEITLYASNGTTSLGAGVIGYTFLVGDGVDDRIVSFRASLGGANRALAGLTYRGNIDFYGTDDLVVTVDDGGRFGRGVLCEQSATPGGGGSDLDGDYPACPQVTIILAGNICHSQGYAGTLQRRLDGGDVPGFASAHSLDPCRKRLSDDWTTTGANLPFTRQPERFRRNSILRIFLFYLPLERVTHSSSR